MMDTKNKTMFYGSGVLLILGFFFCFPWDFIPILHQSHYSPPSLLRFFIASLPALAYLAVGLLLLLWRHMPDANVCFCILCICAAIAYCGDSAYNIYRTFRIVFDSVFAGSTPEFLEALIDGALFEYLDVRSDGYFSTRFIPSHIVNSLCYGGMFLFAAVTWFKLSWRRWGLLAACIAPAYWLITNVIDLDTSSYEVSKILFFIFIDTPRNLLVPAGMSLWFLAKPLWDEKTTLAPQSANKF